MNALVKEKLTTLFREDEQNLYLSYDELSYKYPNTTPTTWENYLDENDVKHYVLQRTAKLTEINARKALKRLAGGGFDPQEVSALKQLIESSSLLQKKANQHEHVFVSFVPVPEYVTHEQ